MSLTFLNIIFKYAIVVNSIAVNLPTSSAFHVFFPSAFIKKIIVSIIILSEALFLILFPLAYVYLPFWSFPYTIAVLFTIEVISLVILLFKQMNLQTQALPIVTFPLSYITILFSFPVSSIWTTIVHPASPITGLYLSHNPITLFLFIFINFSLIFCSFLVLNNRLFILVDNLVII
jgi:hypothetical protein